MDRSDPNVLLFLAPGLIHQLGNVFLTIHGNARMLTTGDVDRSRSAILHAAERGSSSLHLLRFLLGDPAPADAAVDEVLAQVAELARIPVREAACVLDLRGVPAQPAIRVDPADVAVRVAEAVCRLVTVLPTGATGTIAISLATAAAGSVGVSVRFEATPGSLPFPLAVAHLQAGMDMGARRRTSAATCRVHAAGFDFQFPCRSATSGVEA